MAIDLSKPDDYPNQVVPDEDVELCLKVLRTIRNACLGPHFFDAEGAVLLSHAHAKIVELCEACDTEVVYDDIPVEKIEKTEGEKKDENP